MDYQFDHPDVSVVKEQLEMILKCSYDGIYITDAQGVFQIVNSGLERITSLKKEELVGKSVRYLVDNGIINTSVVERVLASKQCVTVTQHIKGIIVKEVITTATPIFDQEGNIRYVVANLRDMTDLVYLQKEFDRLQGLSRQYYSELIKEKRVKEDIVAESDEMIRFLQLALRIAHFDSTVLLEGESGVGKEVISRFIHEMSERNRGPFVSVNCAAVPEALLESELFGYEAGAFTGARREGKAGVLALAEEGILFLDEINSMPLSLQGKVLRVIETGEFMPIGSTRTVKVNFRLIAATNQSLEELVDRKLFRQDLFFRLYVVPLKIPPLRERRKDIIPMALHYLAYYNKKYNTNKEIETSVMAYFERYHWPGNVRELKNLVERLVVLSADDLIRERDLPDEILYFRNSEQYQIIVRDLVPLSELLDEAEKQLLKMAEIQCDSTREISKRIGISQTSVVRKLKKIHMES